MCLYFEWICKFQLINCNCRWSISVCISTNCHLTETKIWKIIRMLAKKCPMRNGLIEYTIQFDVYSEWFLMFLLSSILHILCVHLSLKRLALCWHIFCWILNLIQKKRKKTKNSKDCHLALIYSKIIVKIL